MVRVRHYDKDTPFGAWLRDQGKNGKIPSNADELGITATDVDMVVHCWKNHHTGKMLKALSWLEVKTRCADVRFAQNEIFSYMTMMGRQIETDDGEIVRFYGVLRVRMSGTSPYNSENIVFQRWNWRPHGWKRKPRQNELRTDKISEKQLVELIRMDLNPISLKRWKPEDSHHGQTVKTEFVTLPLFGDVEKPIIFKY